ncbi:MAG: ribokinase [Planctomycetota bacterium]
MNGICVLGSLNMDLVIRAPRLPAPGETLLGGPFGTFLGGKGANQAVAAARLQSEEAPPVTLAGRVGDDAHGEELRQGLLREGLDLQYLRSIQGQVTGVALITVDDAGENSIVVASGANASFLPDDLPVGVIRQAGLIVCQLELPLPTVERAAVLANAAGVPIVLNAAPACPLPLSLLARLDLLVVNRSEAALLAGCGESEPAEELAAYLLATGAKAVVVTLGRDGALLSNGGRTIRQDAFAVNSIDAVAAGDAFVGALAVAWLERKPDPDALRFACAAGALATTRAGAIPSLPTRGEVRTLAPNGLTG